MVITVNVQKSAGADNETIVIRLLMSEPKNSVGNLKQKLLRYLYKNIQDIIVKETVQLIMLHFQDEFQIKSQNI